MPDKPKYEPVYLKETLKQQEFLKKLIKEKQLVKIPVKGGGVEDGWLAVRLGNASEAWGGELLVEMTKDKKIEQVPLEELIKNNQELY